MANPLAEIKIQPIDEKTIFAWFAVFKNFADGFCEFGRNGFVGIEA